MAARQHNRTSHRAGVEVPDRDLIRKLRYAFAGMPADSAFDKHCLVWSHHDVLQAAFISDMPDALSHENSTYQLQQPYLGDWDPLLSPAQRLVGFSIFLRGDEQIITSDFLRRHKGLRFADGMLHIVLTADRSYGVECVQGIGTRMYANSHGDYMFLFPEWCEWGDFEFPICSVGTPVPVSPAAPKP